MTTETPITPPHQWTHDGNRVLMLKCVSKERTSHGGFQWPERGVVKCPDWSPEKKCGNGLHGWPWGLAMGDGAEPNYQSVWLVLSVDPANIVDLGGKAKCSECEVVECGTYLECHLRVLPSQIAWTQHAARGAASATGGRSIAAVTGYRPTVECGPRDLAVATSDEVIWRVHPGAVLCQRTDKGTWLLFADEWDIADGECVMVEHGVIWQDWE